MPDDKSSQLTTQNCQLLVVDDEENVLKAIQRQLRKKFRVHIATSAEEGYEILRENPIDVVLSDQRMPGTTGAEFLMQVRRDFPKIVRLMLTGYADINAVIAAINEGRVEQYIQKPWNPDELEQIITEKYEIQALRTANEHLASELALALEAEKHFSQLRSDFIMLVSHEFRTPLAIIMSSADTLRAYRTKLDPEQIESRLEQIVDQVKRMKYLLEEVSAVGMYEHNIHTFQPQDIDVSAQFRACIDTIKATLSDQHILVTDIPEQGTRFVGDARIITEVVTELVTNALKFSPHGGTILCKLVVEATYVEIAISDEGMGILDKDIERIFNPFVRGENVDTIPGIGLGLAIVRHAVNVHHGQIFVESNNGKGTTLRVVLQSLSDDQ